MNSPPLPPGDQRQEPPEGAPKESTGNWGPVSPTLRLIWIVFAVCLGITAVGVLLLDGLCGGGSHGGPIVFFFLKVMIGFMCLTIVLAAIVNMFKHR